MGNVAVALSKMRAMTKVEREEFKFMARVGLGTYTLVKVVGMAQEACRKTEAPASSIK